MRFAALFLALLPLAALAQPDPFAPTPLIPGTFELTVHDDGERDVEGTALFTAYPEALGGGWTLLLNSDLELFAFERGSRPTMAGADFSDARTTSAPDNNVHAYVRLDDESAGVFSTGASPPDSPNRLGIAESDAQHVLGAFDFSAVRVSEDGSEDRLRISGRFHALEKPNDGGDGGDGGGDGGGPPIATSGTCPDIFGTVGAGRWSGNANRTNVGGPASVVDASAMGGQGWQMQLLNGCNVNYPGSYTLGFNHMHALRTGIYRVLDVRSQTRPGIFEVAGYIEYPYNMLYAFSSGYLWITNVEGNQIDGTYSGFAVAVPPTPDTPPGPPLFNFGRFSARSSARGVQLPPGFELPEGVELPPGVELPTGDGGN